MKECQGDLFSVNAPWDWICIPTNGVVNSYGAAVMGKGVALEAKQRCPLIEDRLGYLLKYSGNHVYRLGCYFNGPSYELLSFPTKHHWRDPSDLNLIIQSCKELRVLRYTFGWDRYSGEFPRIALPKVGCGNGGLRWEDVKPVLEEFLPEDTFIVIHP